MGGAGYHSEVGAMVSNTHYNAKPLSPSLSNY